ncbi:MAG TPA: ABC transporter permease subunit [Candidatus Limnocylindria bacterium]|nr:ABC transporter permease subunit [Candidatus Limnocylindria bacterium]
MTATAVPVRPSRRSALREFGGSVATIAVKELRSRMRGRRAFVVLTIYLGLLALLTYGIYVVVAPNARSMSVFGGSTPNASALIGQAIFTFMSIFQLILVAFIAPAFTAGQISLEREKQTLDLLVSTPMRPAAIVIGKLAAALAFVVLMIVAAIPITAIVLMYGGASIDDIVRQQLVLLASATALGSVGLFFSALLKRTQAATVLTYITMLFLTLGTALLFAFWTIVLIQSNAGNPLAGSQRAPEQVLYVNPGVAMLDVVANTEPGGGAGVASFLNQLRGETPSFTGGRVDCIGPDCVAVDDFGNPVGQPFDIASTGYWWPRIALTLLGLSVILTFAATRLVVPAGMRWAFRRRTPRRAATSGATPVATATATATDEIEELQP